MTEHSAALSQTDLTKQTSFKRQIYCYNHHHYHHNHLRHHYHQQQNVGEKTHNMPLLQHAKNYT
jgi:hypothetical protein